MIKYQLFTICACATLALVSCDNPADDTTDAEVSVAKEVLAKGADGAKIYNFTENSKITFIGSKLTGSMSGGFKKTEGAFKLKDGKPVSGSFTIDMNSIYSENDKLTAHLKNEDFFNVPQFPIAKFEVTEFGSMEDNVQLLSGNLTMLGVTKNITIPAKVAQSEEMVKLTSKFDINRHDWGIVYKGKPDDLIRNEVVIEFDLEAKVNK